MSEEPFDQELKVAFSAPELPHDFVKEVIEDIDRHRRRAKRWRWVGAAAAMVLGTMMWQAWPNPTSNEIPQALARVSDGRLGVRSQASQAVALFASDDRFALAVGMQLETERAIPARVEIESLGILTLERESLTEVKAMEWKQFGSGVAVGAVTVGVIVGAIEWRSGGVVQRAGAGEELKLKAAEASAQAPVDVAALHKDKEALLAKLDEAQARVAELEKAATRTPVATKAEPEMTKAPEPAAAAKLAARFGDPDFQKVLDEVDWDKTGEAFKNMAPLMDQLTEAFENDKPLPESVADLQKWNAELVTVAIKVMNAGVPGTGANGAFTHPSVAGNQIFATLAKMGQPLDESQQASLDAITSRLSSEDASRRAGYSEDTSTLRQILEETSLRDRFYEEAGKLLTPSQYGALYPERRVGRMGADLYSSGLVYAQVAKGVPVRDRSDYESQIQESLSRKFKLDDSSKAQLANIVRQWSSQDVSDAALSYQPDKLAAKGMHKVAKAKQFAELQLSLQEKILKEMNLTPSQKKALLKNPEIWIPILQKD